ncbi:hypothetical protein RRG08_002994, partial [Elysia crispata]
MSEKLTKVDSLHRGDRETQHTMSEEPTKVGQEAFIAEIEKTTHHLSENRQKWSTRPFIAEIERTTSTMSENRQKLRQDSFHHGGDRGKTTHHAQRTDKSGQLSSRMIEKKQHTICQKTDKKWTAFIAEIEKVINNNTMSENRQKMDSFHRGDRENNTP